MNLFLLLVDPDGGPILEATRRRYATVRCCADLELEWHEAESAAVLLARDDLARAGFGPVVTRWETYLAAGNVRLDNRSDVARWAGCRDPGRSGASDLDLVVRAVALRGEGVVPDILGDFAFAIWDTATRRVVAARDAFGVKRLCYREGPHLLAFSSRAELLAEGDAYDIQPLVEMIAMCNPSPDRTVYAGVRAVPPASVIRGRAGALAVQEYWSPERFEPRPVPPGREQDCYDAFRTLFAESVRQRLTGEGDVWSQLSGGLDSSSVVSMAQWLAQRGEVPHGVSGTISWVYRWSTDGDEREYSDAVAKQWGVRNEVMLDTWFWKDDGQPPPLMDEPHPELPAYARERRAARFVRDSGGRVILTGLGSDQYLFGNMFFFADWVAQGRIRETLQDLLRRAAIGRVSVWHLAYENVALPLLPPAVRRILVRDSGVAPWLSPSARPHLHSSRSAQMAGYAGRIKHKYAGVVHAQMRALPHGLRRSEILGDELDVRHPFLYRPLVEFGLCLTPEMCVQPHRRKWILRQALSGILPESVGTRVGKAANSGCAMQSLIHERHHLAPLLTDPLLAELGLVDPKALQAGFTAACAATDDNLAAALLHTLAIEGWLHIRSGRRIRRDEPRAAIDG